MYSRASGEEKETERITL